MQDWAAHLEYLQFILLEFDTDRAPKEGTMIRYFRDGLIPSIWAEMEQCRRELNSFKELVEKAIDAKARAALRPRSYARETDQHCPRGSWPAHSTTAKAQGQGFSMKDPRVEEPRFKPQEPKSFAPQQQAEASEKARKEKKKKSQQYGRDCQKVPPLPQELMQLSLVSPRKRTMIRIEIVWIGRHVTLVRSSARTVRKWGIIPESVLSQKTSFSLSNFCVGG